MPRIVAIANQKGGVGKTTTAVNLAAALALAGERVLVIDLDPQGNASTALGMGWQQRQRNVYHVLCDECGLAEAVMPTGVDRLTCVPATVDLAAIEVELSESRGRELLLREVLQQLNGFLATRRPDVVLIDCPPALGLLTVNALAAADSLLVPLQAEFLALEGLSHLLRTVETVTDRINPGLMIDGVLMTMVDRRNNLCAAVVDDARSYLGELVYATEIPRNVRLSEAPSHGMPVALYDPRCAGTQAYAALADEFLARHRAWQQRTG
ncbi:MAG: ParA family protein [Alphaproteobacteria bacterium]|nr:ParA family protein [Alphaproteobacteria bacterium]MCB9927961.1 ParA family protein [Alphaproteobacteria bacterium]